MRGLLGNKVRHILQCETHKVRPKPPAEALVGGHSSVDRELLIGAGEDPGAAVGKDPWKRTGYVDGHLLLGTEPNFPGTGLT